MNRIAQRTGLFTAAVLIVTVGCATVAIPPIEGIAIENVTVIDGVNAQRFDQRVIIQGDRILSITPMSDTTASATEVVNATGKFLIPGLWDMHVHFLYEEALTLEMADLFLNYGITSVRDTGGDLALITALRRGLQEREAPAPRIFISGPLLDGRFVVYDGSEPGQPPLGTDVPDTHAAREKVQELAAAGVDFIKIYELVDPAVFDALVSEANLLGLPIAAHVPLMMTADSAGPAVNSMEHLRNIELACAADWQKQLAARQSKIRAFNNGRGFDLRSDLHTAQRLPAIAAYDEARCNEVLDTLTNTVQVPTLRLNTVATVRPFEIHSWADALKDLPEDTQSEWLERAAQMTLAAPTIDPTFSDWSLFLVSRLKERGVPVGAGTDTPIGLGIPGYSLHEELELLVLGGLTPTEALHAATVEPARFFGREEDMGRIEPGMLADLVLLDADPLTDIRNTRSIRRVMASGVWVR